MSVTIPEILSHYSALGYSAGDVLSTGTVSGVAGWQSRFRWIVRPGNDIYVVYTHNWLDDPLLAQFATQDRRLSTKALYTYRF